MLSQELALEKQANSWKFLELWVDPVLFLPKILMIIGDQDSTYRIFSPASDYKLIVSHSSYQEAEDWLIEDEYERVDGQLSAEEIL